MERFVKGDVVVIPFPFSDLSQTKRRPAVVISVLDGDDLILCQITSQTLKDRYAIPLSDEDFEENGLHRPSNIRPNRLFTAEKSIILYRIGALMRIKLDEVISRIVTIIRD